MNVYNIYVYLFVYVRFDREKRQTDSLTLYRTVKNSYVE